MNLYKCPFEVFIQVGKPYLSNGLMYVNEVVCLPNVQSCVSNIKNSRMPRIKRLMNRARVGSMTLPSPRKLILELCTCLIRCSSYGFKLQPSGLVVIVANIFRYFVALTVILADMRKLFLFTVRFMRCSDPLWALDVLNLPTLQLHFGVMLLYL